MSPRVLIVDDDPDVRVYLASFLGDNGYDAVTAPDTAEALRVMETSPPEIVLVDILMPGQSGLALLVQLQRDPRWSRVPVVVVTGMDRILQDDCQSLLGARHGVRGPDAVLGKPVDPDALLTVIGHLSANGVQRAG